MTVGGFERASTCIAILLATMPCCAAGTPVVPPLAGATAGQWQYLKLANGSAYDVLLPFGYSTRLMYPVILYLHGVGTQMPAGTPPSNAFAVLMNSVSVKGVNYRAAYPAIIVAPQCAFSQIGTNDWGGTKTRVQNNRLSNTRMPCGDNAIAAVEKTLAATSADRRKVTIVGYSMGAIGAYYLFATHQHLFAAAMPVAGTILGGVTPMAFDRLLPDKPLWAFHGFDDRIVPKAFDEALYGRNKRHHGRMKYTEFTRHPHVTAYPSLSEPQNGDGHPNADTAAFEMSATLDWLLSQSEDCDFHGEF